MLSTFVSVGKSNESNCTIDGRKLVWFSQAVIDVGNIQKAFG